MRVKRHPFVADVELVLEFAAPLLLQYAFGFLPLTFAFTVIHDNEHGLRHLLVRVWGGL